MQFQWNDFEGKCMNNNALRANLSFRWLEAFVLKSCCLNVVYLFRTVLHVGWMFYEWFRIFVNVVGLESVRVRGQLCEMWQDVHDMSAPSTRLGVSVCQWPVVGRNETTGSSRKWYLYRHLHVFSMQKQIWWVICWSATHGVWMKIIYGNNHAYIIYIYMYVYVYLYIYI